jgi:hypothetical protein
MESKQLVGIKIMDTSCFNCGNEEVSLRILSIKDNVYPLCNVCFAGISEIIQEENE